LTLSTGEKQIAIFALDGFDTLQVSGIIAAVNAVGSMIPKVISTRKGRAYPRGVEKGDENASGVIDADFDLESATSTQFDALFIPDGDETFAEQLESEKGLKWIRETAANYKTSAFLSSRSVFLFAQPPLRSSFIDYSVGAVGAAVPVIAHKALPGDTDLKADLSAAFSSKKGFVLAQNLASDETSTWGKITGVKDLGGFGYAFFDAISNQPHQGQSPVPALELFLVGS